MRDRLEAVGDAVLAGEDAEHARQGARGGGVDGADAGMRVRAAHHHRVGLPLQAEIVGEAPLAGEEAQILLAAQRLADGLELGGVELLHDVPIVPIHLPAPAGRRQHRRTGRCCEPAGRR